MPSYREGSPKSLIEASACGRAIVSTNVPGCRDVVINNQNGLLVEPKNTFELVKAIEKLILDHNLRLFFGKNGRKFAKEKFSLNLVVDKHIELYKKMI